MTDESPEYTNLFGDILKPGCTFIRSTITIENYVAGVFNWSMTYHSSSDVPTPYGRVVLGPSNETEGGKNYYGEKKQGVGLLSLCICICSCI